MSNKILNKVNNDIFSYETTGTGGVFKMSRVMPTEIHHTTAGVGTNGYLLASTGNGWTWTDPATITAGTSLTAGTGVSITNNVVSIGQSVNTTDTVTFHTVSASNYNVGNKNVISASAQGSFTDLELKNNNGTKLLIDGDSGDITCHGTLSIDAISEKTIGSGITLSSVVKMTGIQSATNSNKLLYDATTGEITYQPDSSGGATVIDGTSLRSTLPGNNVNASLSVSLGHNAGNSGQGANAVAIGADAGYSNQEGENVAIGYEAGRTSQGSGSIAIGRRAGRDSQADFNGIAIGNEAGMTRQGNYGIAIGRATGEVDQDYAAIAIGLSAGRYNAQGNSAVAIGHNAGNNNQGNWTVALGTHSATNDQSDHAVAVGDSAGRYSQSTLAVAVGGYAGNSNQGFKAVALGVHAGTTTQGQYTVAVGNRAGRVNQGEGSIAIGSEAGLNYQGIDCIAIGRNAGTLNDQGNQAVAIGFEAGYDNQGAYSIAIGNNAGRNVQAANSIVLNAQSGIALDAASTGFFVKPIRDVVNANKLLYNNTTGEITYQPDSSLNGVNLTTLNIGEILSYNGTNWVNNSNIKSLTDTLDGTSYDYINVTSPQHVKASWNYDENGLSITAPHSSMRLDGGLFISSKAPITIPDPADQNSTTKQVLGAIGYQFGGTATDLEVDFMVEGTSMLIGDTFIGPNGNLVLFGDILSNTGQTILGTGGIVFETELGVWNEDTPKTYSSGDDGQVLVSQGQNRPPKWISLESGGSTEIVGSSLRSTLPGNNVNNTLSISIGEYAGNIGQLDSTVAIGASAGRSNQKYASTAVGWSAGYNNQGQFCTAIGTKAGYENQGDFSTAIGYAAGYLGLSANSIAIGHAAAFVPSASLTNYIVINASGTSLEPASSNGFHVKPIRDAVSANKLLYNNTTGEITYQPDSGGGGSINHLTIEDSPGGIFIGQNTAANILSNNNVISIGNNAGNNVSTETTDRIAIGNSAGYTEQQTYSICIGTSAGQMGGSRSSVIMGYKAGMWWPGAWSVFIGEEAGYNGSWSECIAIGKRAGYQSAGYRSIAIGYNAASTGQGNHSLYIGDEAGATGNEKTNVIGIGQRAGNTHQADYSIAIGTNAGWLYQKTRCVAIGLSAGRSNQGEYSVAIGCQAGNTDQAANSIVLNAQTNTDLNPANTGFFVKPIRNVASTTGDKLCYDSGTGEISYQPDSGGGGGGEELTLKYPLQTALIQGPSSNSEFGACTITNNTGTRIAVGVTGLNLVKVYEWTSGSWVQMGSDINAPTGWWGAKFGRTLDFDDLGNNIIIGSPHHYGGGGGAYVFQWNGSSWLQKGANIIPASSHWWSFGSQVCMNSDGSIILVSAKNADDGSTRFGRIYAYQWNGSSWVDYGNSPAARGNTPQNGGTAFMGHSLKLSSDGNTFIAGAPGWTGTTANMGYMSWGHFVMYTLQNGTWTDVQITYPNSSIPRGWGEGLGIGITGSLNFDKIALVVGGQNLNAHRSGSVYMLERTGNDYVPYGSNYIIEGEGGQNDFFGSAGSYSSAFPQNIHMSSDGTVLAVGSILNEANYTASNSNVGQVRVYKYNGESWSLMFKTLFGENASDYFGALDLTTDGTKLIVGASQSGVGNGYIKTYDLTEYTTTKLSANASVIGVGNDVDLTTHESSHYNNDEIQNKSSDELKYGTQGQYLVSGGHSNPMKWISKPYASFVRPWNAPQFTIVANSAWTEINWTQVKFSSGIYLDSGGYHFRVIRSGAYSISVQCRFGGGDMWTGLVLLDKDEDYVGRGIIAQSAGFGTVNNGSDVVNLNILAEINETQHCVVAFYRQDGNMTIINPASSNVGHQMVCNIICVS